MYDAPEFGNLFIFSSISLASTIPHIRLTCVNVPLSGVTIYCPVAVFTTTLFLSVPTPGSTTDTKTVPSAQYIIV